MCYNGMPRKAMLLAAGYGSRLRPVTDMVPKCMAPVGGKPLLEHTLERLCRYGVTDLVVNVSYLAGVLLSYFGNGERWGVRLTYSVEDEPLGTAGGVKRVSHLFDEAFFLLYGDNLSTCRLDRMWEFHCQQGGLATLALHHRDDPTQSGIVGLDDKDRIVRFLEKPRPDQVFSHWVSAGIAILEPEVLAAIPEGGTPDFGKDVFPALLSGGAPLNGYRMTGDENLWWVDNLADLERVEREWREREASA